MFGSQRHRCHRCSAAECSSPRRCRHHPIPPSPFYYPPSIYFNECAPLNFCNLNQFNILALLAASVRAQARAHALLATACELVAAFSFVSLKFSNSRLNWFANATWLRARAISSYTMFRWWCDGDIWSVATARRTSSSISVDKFRYDYVAHCVCGQNECDNLAEKLQLMTELVWNIWSQSHAKCHMLSVCLHIQLHGMETHKRERHWKIKCRENRHFFSFRKTSLTKHGLNDYCRMCVGLLVCVNSAQAINNMNQPYLVRIVIICEYNWSRQLSPAREEKRATNISMQHI